MQLQIDTLRMTGGFPEDLTGMVSWEDGVILDPVEIILGDVGMTLNVQDDLIVGRLVDGGRLRITSYNVCYTKLLRVCL